jgi:hypothetical protein
MKLEDDYTYEDLLNELEEQGDESDSEPDLEPPKDPEVVIRESLIKEGVNVAESQEASLAAALFIIEQLYFYLERRLPNLVEKNDSSEEDVKKERSDLEKYFSDYKRLYSIPEVKDLRGDDPDRLRVRRLQTLEGIHNDAVKNLKVLKDNLKELEGWREKGEFVNAEVPGLLAVARRVWSTSSEYAAEYDEEGGIVQSPIIESTGRVLKVLLSFEDYLTKKYGSK